MSSESDESDNIGFLGEQSDGGERSDAPSEADDADSSPHHALFDLEAADSDDHASDDDDSDGDSDGNSDGNSYGDSDGDHVGVSGRGASRLNTWSETRSFPQFARLPFELRYRIWEYFCPDLTAKSRVYWLRLALSPALGRGVPPTFVIQEGPFVEQQTRAARAMLAVHQQSRQMALKAFPDTLPICGDGLIRYSSVRDVVFMDCAEVVRYLGEFPPLPGFADNIRHLTLEPAVLTTLEHREHMDSLFAAFGALETLYYIVDPIDHKWRRLRWCAFDPVKRYFLTTVEDETGLGEDGEHMYCWPDTNHPAFAKPEIPLEAMADDLRSQGINSRLMRGAKWRGISVWPMVQFLHDNIYIWDDILAWHDNDMPFSDSASQSSSDDEPEPDEYESEGIDDSEISDTDSQESDSHDLIVVDDDSDDGAEVDEGGSSSRSQPPHPTRHPHTIDLTGDDDENLARFSSPEQSSATLRVSDESGNESDQPAPRTSKLKRPRARVAESESEDDNPDDDIPRKRARIERRPPPIVLSSDAEDDGKVATHPQRRARVVIVDDDSDEEQGGEQAAEDNNGGDGHGWSGLSSSEEDEEESGDSDGGAPANKPLTLAEKLQLHRDRNPIPLSEGEADSEVDRRRDSDEMSGDDMSGDDYDARDYADFQDDEDGNQVSDDGGEDGQEVEEEYDDGSDGY